MEIVEKLSPNCEGRGGKDVIGIILHFTAGGDSEGTVRWFMNPDANVSAHYVVSRSGKIIRMVREEMSAWHAGSSTTVPKLNGVKGLNQKTIGIEICNWGWLLKAEERAIVTVNNKTYERQIDQFYTRLRKWTYPFKGSVAHHKVTSKVLTKGKNPFPLGDTCYHWETFHEDQLAAVVWLIKDILTRYPNITREWIARHQDVDPTRKLDTGPAFPLNNILDEVFPEVETSDNYQIGMHEEDTVSTKDMEDAYETDRCKEAAEAH
jgi:N-acetyl-anhydromuramyl-L-alanine amidase AmpD